MFLDANLMRSMIGGSVGGYVSPIPWENKKKTLLVFFSKTETEAGQESQGAYQKR